MRDLDSLVSQVKAKIGDFKVDVALALGSGWGDSVKNMDIIYEVNYADIDGLPQCSVKGHEGKFLFAKCGDKNVGIMQGRFHIYEGYTANETTLGLQILEKLGAKCSILTNACGGLRKDYKVNDIVVCSDVINFTGRNCLEGVLATEERPIFIPMSNCLDEKLIEIAEKNCKKCEINYHLGIYGQVLGPVYETNAEVEMFRRLGVDCVGMSTVQEVIMSKYLGIKVLCLAYITDVAGADDMENLSHEDVLACIQKNIAKCGQLLADIIKEIEL